MKAAQFTLTSTVVAAVFGLALGFWATSAEAHCKGKHLVGGQCITHNVDQRSETFTVELNGGSIGGSLVTDGCEGSSRRKQVTDANFPPVDAPGCVGLTIEDGLGDIQFLHLCQINLNHKFRIDMTVTIFATSGFGVVGGVLCPNDVYQGEFNFRFDEDKCDDLVLADATCVTIIEESPLFLEKTGQPGKGDIAGPVTTSSIFCRRGFFGLTLGQTPCGDAWPDCERATQNG